MFRKRCAQVGPVVSEFDRCPGETSGMNIARNTTRLYGYGLAGLVAVLPLAAPAVDDTRAVQCPDGLLSVKVRDAALDVLLEEIARECGFSVERYVALEQKLSAEFDRLTLDQALRRILRTRSYALKYASPTSGKRSPAAGVDTLWILPQGDEKYSMQPPASAAAGDPSRRTESKLEVADALSVLRHGSAEDREQAALALGKRGDARAVAPLRQALADASADVRDAAIASLAEVGGADAALALAPALRDGDPRTREQAVNALGEIGGPAAADFLRYALADDAAFVRLAAAEILEQLRSEAQ